jgi:hypothetical protein
MKNNRQIHPLATLITVLSASLASGAVVLVDNDFGAGSDTGPTFQQVTNGFGTSGTGSSNPSTGVILSSTGATNGAYGLNTGSTVSASTGAGYTGFSITWTVSTAAYAPGTVIANGWFFGVTNSTLTTGSGLYNNTNNYIGVILDGDPGAGNPATWSLVYRDNTGSPTVAKTNLGLSGTAPSETEVENGPFSITLTVNSNNTWSVSSVGLGNDATSSSGTLNPDFTYDDLASSLVPNTTIQGNAQGYTVDHVTLTAIPEPGSLLLLGLGGLCVLRRRRA